MDFCLGNNSLSPSSAWSPGILLRTKHIILSFPGATFVEVQLYVKIIEIILFHPVYPQYYFNMPSQLKTLMWFFTFSLSLWNPGLPVPLKHIAYGPHFKCSAWRLARGYRFGVCAADTPMVSRAARKKDLLPPDTARTHFPCSQLKATAEFHADSDFPWMETLTLTDLNTWTCVKTPDYFQPQTEWLDG